jgi:hypothetical protein
VIPESEERREQKRKRRRWQEYKESGKRDLQVRAERGSNAGIRRMRMQSGGEEGEKSQDEEEGGREDAERISRRRTRGESCSCIQFPLTYRQERDGQAG